jgi:hypothetical protein
MNITVEIKAPELAKAIEALAASLTGGKNLINLNGAEKAKDFAGSPEAAVMPENSYVVPNTQVQQAPISVPSQTIPTTLVPTQPVPTYQPAQHQAPPQQQAPVVDPIQQPQAVPTTAPTYTMDHLAVAATQLMDAGKRNELVQLLASFGVQALTGLPKEAYGAFATKLREMGAKL